MEHCANARRKNKTFAVHSAIRKYGQESIEVETLASADDWGLLAAMEISAIAKHGTYSPEGYNLTRGGEGMLDLSPESRLKKSAALTGRVLSQESRKKISAAASKQMQSTELREKLSDIAKKRRLSDETKAKISAASIIALSSDAVRKKISEGTRLGQDNPLVRARMSERSVDMWAREGARTAHAAKIKAKWDNPEWREKTLKSRLEKRLQKA